jgi:hypothetical protein
MAAVIARLSAGHADRPFHRLPKGAMARLPLLLALSLAACSAPAAPPSRQAPSEVSLYYLWGQGLLACFDKDKGWSTLGLEGLDNCPYRPKSPPGETQARATALGTAHGNIPLPACPAPRPVSTGLTGPQAAQHLREAILAKTGQAPNLSEITVGGSTKPHWSRGYEVELDGDALPDRLVSVTGTSRAVTWTALLMFPGQAPTKPRVVAIVDDDLRPTIDLDYCTDFDGDGRNELLLMVSGSVELSGLEASLGAPARARAKKYDFVDWGYLLVELEGDQLAARGAIYRESSRE